MVNLSTLGLEAKFTNSICGLIVACGMLVLGILSINNWQWKETNGENVHVSLSCDSGQILVDIIIIIIDISIINIHRTLTKKWMSKYVLIFLKH